MDLLGRGIPPIPGEESGEAGPLLEIKESLAGLGIQSRWKKPIDMELRSRDSDRPKGPGHILLIGTYNGTGPRDHAIV